MQKWLIKLAWVKLDKGTRIEITITVERRIIVSVTDTGLRKRWRFQWLDEAFTFTHYTSF